MMGARLLLLAAALGATGCGSLRSNMIGFTVVGAGLEGGLGYAIAPAGKQGRAAVVGTAGGALSGALISYGLYRLSILDVAPDEPRPEPSNAADPAAADTADATDPAGASAPAPGFTGRAGGFLVVTPLGGEGEEPASAAQEWRHWQRTHGFPTAAVLWPDLFVLDRRPGAPAGMIGIYSSFAIQAEARDFATRHDLPATVGDNVLVALPLNDAGALPRLVEVLIELPLGPAERTTLSVVTPERSSSLRAATGGEASIWVAHPGKVSVDVRFPDGDAGNAPEKGLCFAGSTHAEVTIDVAQAGPPETTPPVRLQLGHHTVPCPH